MKTTIIVALIILILDSCERKQDNGKTYNETYLVSVIPDKKSFLKLTEQEKAADSIFGSYDKTVDSEVLKNDRLKENSFLQKRAFLENRSRIYLQAYENGKPAKVDNAFSMGVPAPCECRVKRDTIFINMGIGFFGGMAFNIAISKNSFQSYYYLYTDDVKPYKASLKDSFSNEVNVKSKFQYLILDSKPTFEEGQQLNGYFTITSQNYYEKPYGDKLDTNYVVSKIYFTCTTKRELK